MDADEIVGQAWGSLPPADRSLLQSIGVSQWRVVHEPLGAVVHRFRRSAGVSGLTFRARAAHDLALAVWDRELRIVLINEAHSKLCGLDASAREQFIARLAWHEWGHALSIERCQAEEIARGRQLLEPAPRGVREVIRMAGYRPNEYTHEVIAETYALMVARRMRDGAGRPIWLHDEIYSLMKKVVGWSD